MNNLELGDKIRITGTLEKATNNTVPNTFNYKKYLENKNIYYLISIDKISKISNNTSIYYYIKNWIIKRINKIDHSGYLNTFILGNKKEIDSDQLNSYQENGVSHLFAISGMHISLLATIMLYILTKISYNIRLNYTIVIVFLIFYLFISGISASILRATIMYILLAINKCYNLKVKNIDIILITLIIIIIINSYLIYDIGFQFSYIISFTLIVKNKQIGSFKNNITKSLYISWICFLVSLPIAIYNFYQINILSIIFNLILIPLVSTLIYPLSLLTFLIPRVYKIFELIINILENINNLFYQIDIFKMVLPKPSIYLIIIYYITIWLTIYNKKFTLLFILLITIHKSYIYLDSSFQIITIDVGQGDSIFIKFSNNKGNILIDTGGIISYNKEKWQVRKSKYSIIKSKTIPYLKSLGINKLDYIVLSHGDFDHMGEAINLVNNFKVEKVIFNCGEFNDLEQELIKVLDKKKIKYYSCIKELNIDDNKLYFLQTKEYDNENDNSNVIYTELVGYKFLFMGDAGIEKEKDILDKYNISDIDVLKVGHHGSKTSSSREFINEIEPKYSIISVGKNNRYGHPNKEVLNILDSSKIYRTEQDGSIMFKIKNNKLKIEICSP